jgi:hypothetical protein
LPLPYKIEILDRPENSLENIIKVYQDQTNLCLNVCNEFLSLGFLKDIDPRTLKESYNIIKQPNGNWFKSTKLNLHDSPKFTTLDFEKMPMLKILTDLINEIDSEFKKNGGRIFINQSTVSKIKKGSESPILLSSDLNKHNITKPGPYQKLCDELIKQDVNQDRFRTEETYLITKTSNGEWSMSSGDNNLSTVKKNLTLSKMPELKKLTLEINKFDLQFKTNGGRIFVTPTRIYRIKNKIEVEFKFENKSRDK